MRNLNKILTEYLSKSTDYAIQIVGDWGQGKTYYYRKDLELLISNSPTFLDEKKNYKPIYISLFGLKNIEEIETKIVFEFYQSKYFKSYLNNKIKRKGIKITDSVLKIGFRGFLNLQKLGSVNDYYTDIKNIGKTALNTNELVICFDDLERKGFSLHNEDLIGYINNLVDVGIKILIISNDDILLKKDDSYKYLKEKIIGITIEFNPDVNDTIESIINIRYSGFPLYKEYLHENILMLNSISNSANNNYRHLIYSLDCLHCCFSQIKIEILDRKNEIQSLLKEKLQKIVIIILALSIEYKSSKIKNRDKNEYSEQEELRANWGILKPDKIEKESKVEIFKKKYKITTYYYFESIFDYVTGSNEFNIQKFIDEFKTKFHIERGSILPQYELLKSLSYDNCFKLTDKDYKDKTLELIKYAKNGDFSPEEYLTIIHYAERFNNIFELNIDELKSEITSGLKSSLEKLSNEETIEHTRFKRIGDTNCLSANATDLYKFGITEINFKIESTKKKKIETIVTLLTTDLKRYLNEYNTNSDFSYHISGLPFLNYISIDDFLIQIKNSDNEVIIYLKNFFEERYQKIEKFNGEINNLTKLTTLLNNYKEELIKTDKNKIRVYLLNELIKILEMRISSETLI